MKDAKLNMVVQKDGNLLMECDGFEMTLPLDIVEKIQEFLTTNLPVMRRLTKLANEKE